MATANFNNWKEESYTREQLDLNPQYPHVKADWRKDNSGTSVTQTQTCLPSFFYSDFNTFNKTIEVELAIGDKDDDFLGFALNFQPGSTTNASQDILLVDWMGKEGENERPIRMQLSHITYQPSFLGFTHLDYIAEAATLGSTIWEHNRTYKFKFICTESNIKVWVDGSLEFDVSGTFTDGRFACYAFGQREVTFRNVQVETDISGGGFGSGNWELATQTKYQPWDLTASKNFGQFLAISGKSAIISCGKLTADALYFYKWEKVAWQEKQKLITENLSSSYYSVSSLAMSQDTIIVGHASANYDARKNAGAIYTFQLEGETWVQKDSIQPYDLQEYERFGSSVAISGDTLVVGSYKNFEERQEVGAAYIFQRNGGIWQYKSLLQHPEPQEYNRFGFSVAISGDTIFVGTNKNEGSVCVFQLDGEQWQFKQELELSNFPKLPFFGSSLAIDGDKAIVGAPGTSEGGAVYMFQLEGETWQCKQPIQAKRINDGGSRFGGSVDISGDTVILGAEYLEKFPSGNYYVGKAYIYKLEGGTWKEKQKLQAADEQSQHSYFGKSIAISGKLALVGAHDMSNPLDHMGAVYGFESRDDVSK
ncbi:MAG: hypothetical protein F6K21_32525 [Symploca sp. SIO2D2]|nr:hypothetical protein [Symploca sp. SIO2D2]